MRLKLASRKSDLARWQAVQVARVLELLPDKPNIEFLFKSSLGDQNLDVPLASMGSKGVFTEDFYQDLINGQCDLVVHSWKDLPVEPREGTLIAATLPRADMRDLLIVPEPAWQEALKTKHLCVFTSSPRRVYNLSAALPGLLPAPVTLEFVNVRGNVATRLRKMHEQGCALVLAKAGLDRLLQAEAEGFQGEQLGLAPLLADCRFQVLPLSLNPPAPAQGALAIEVSRTNDAMLEFCRQLNDERTYSSVELERDVLRRYGGGCHQKIGVAIFPHACGLIQIVRGLTDQGEVLRRWRLDDDVPWTRASHQHVVFPLEAKENSWFQRERLPLKEDLAARQALFVARAEAWPEEYGTTKGQKVWTAGVATWRRLAERGVWVNGCQDGLGEDEAKGLDLLFGSLRWTKLTHSQSASEADVATYKLMEKPVAPDLRGKTHFYWLSRSAFERAYALFPREIEAGYNACGPGVTYEFLKRQTQLQKKVKVFIGLEQFLAETLPS